ncbi:MAG: serine--tRNA ligase [bacterium]|nr:serine--tRNA ligase [bacterium]
MLQPAEIRANKDLFTERLKKRGLEDIELTLNQILSLDDERKSTQQSLDSTLAESNNAAKEIGMLMKQGKKEEAEQAKAKAAELRDKSKEIGTKMSGIEEELKSLLYNVPNVPHESVPAGQSEDDNEVVFQVPELPEIAEGAKPHWDLIKEYDIIDFDLGNKVSGAGFPFYKKQGARLIRSMINFFLDEAADAGYIEVQAPLLVNEDSGYGTGQLPDKEGQMYHATADNLFLIPTAEVPITNMYRDVIVDENQLPLKNVGHTPCFRREAGSWGAHVRGLNRLHQFDKVEIVQIQHPEKSYEALDEMVKHVEELIKKLGLPYRILRLCGGDLGFTSALTYDFEVYSAAQKRWLEVSSVSNFETYQANRLKLRYKGSDKKKQLLHTLNGSALALPRILAAILENNQTPDGIIIPEVLRPYTGFDKITL